MTLTYQQQQQYYAAEQRRKRAMYRYASITARIRNIAKFIAAGGNPLTDPNVKDEYQYLIGEFGEGIFESEVKALKLMMEDQKGS